MMKKGVYPAAQILFTISIFRYNFFIYYFVQNTHVFSRICSAVYWRYFHILLIKFTGQTVGILVMLTRLLMSPFLLQEIKKWNENDVYKRRLLEISYLSF